MCNCVWWRWLGEELYTGLCAAKLPLNTGDTQSIHYQAGRQTSSRLPVQVSHLDFFWLRPRERGNKPRLIKTDKKRKAPWNIVWPMDPGINQVIGWFTLTTGWLLSYLTHNQITHIQPPSLALQPQKLQIECLNPGIEQCPDLVLYYRGWIVHTELWLGLGWGELFLHLQ